MDSVRLLNPIFLSWSCVISSMSKGLIEISTTPKLPRNLPINPSFEHLRNEAKALLKAYHASDTGLFDDFVHRWPRFKGKSNDEIRAANLSLGDLQFYLAREYEFDTWAQMKQYVIDYQRFDPDNATVEATTGINKRKCHPLNLSTAIPTLLSSPSYSSLQ